MEELFGTVLVVVVAVTAVAALASYVRSGRVYDQLGRGELSLDEPELRSAPEPGSAAWHAEARAELRQLLEAKATRAQMRGEEPIDVEAELARLSAPAAPADAGLRAEVRELVLATNERRERRGEEPLDVDTEVERRLRDAGAG